MLKRLCLAAALLGAVPAFAINKCVDAHGATTFSDLPCPASHKASVVAVKVSTPAAPLVDEEIEARERQRRLSGPHTPSYVGVSTQQAVDEGYFGWNSQYMRDQSEERAYQSRKALAAAKANGNIK